MPDQNLQKRSNIKVCFTVVRVIEEFVAVPSQIKTSDALDEHIKELVERRVRRGYYGTPANSIKNIKVDYVIDDIPGIKKTGEDDDGLITPDSTGKTE